ncbi:CLUMA_CG016602, isoform A [Clunio marinus]|uniref:CLUMA_CG016602, isoform A n=1 Tax=Clunio marinus TaxID=568069 RepID=A0A1J1IU76_9DIPT|nr:CLUMA_CG016602, isoform A [Clunio marinus]
MDPLYKLSDDLLPFVFQHLKAIDIVKASLVSPQWYLKIGKSFECMQKIWLPFYESSSPLYNIKCLLNSERSYQNFKIQRGLPGNMISVFKKFQWKKVMIRDDQEMDCNDFKALMTHIASTVDTLDLWNIGTQVSEDELPAINFPNLRTLEYNFSSNQILPVFFGKNPKLLEVRIVTLAEDDDDELPNEKISRLFKFLDQNPSINDVKFYGASSLFFRSQSNHEISLRLEKFAFADDFLENADKKCFLKFLSKQHNLKDVRFLPESKFNDVNFFVEIWKTLKNCKILTLSKCPNIDAILLLVTNTSIEKIRIESEINVQEAKMLTVTPNLKHLHLRSLNNKLLTYIVNNIKSVKIINYFTAPYEEGLVMEDGFENIELKKISLEDYLQKLYPNE